jgi:hypothetical protein
MKADDAISKIHEDFCGALAYWRHDFDKWVFVHNSKEGLGPRVLKKLNELTTLHHPMIVSSWGFEELRRKVFTLHEVDLAPLLGGGYAPSNTICQICSNLSLSFLLFCSSQISRRISLSNKTEYSPTAMGSASIDLLFIKT